jgi:hypothetical protein
VFFMIQSSLLVGVAALLLALRLNRRLDRVRRFCG